MRRYTGSRPRGTDGARVPETPTGTITDRAYAELNRRGNKAHPTWMDADSVRRRLASNAQHDKASQS